MQKAKLSIGFHCDDVLIPFSESVLEYCNGLYKADMTLEDLHSYNLSECISRRLKISNEKAYDAIVEFCNSQLPDVKPYDDAIKGIEKIVGDGHEAYMISKRREEIQKLTEDMVNRYFPNKFLGVYLTNESSSGGRRISKSEVIRRFELDAFVEDCLETCEEIAEKGTDVIMLEKPWNVGRDIKPGLRGRIYPVKFWDGILRKIDELSYERFTKLTHQ